MTTLAARNELFTALADAFWRILQVLWHVVLVTEMAKWNRVRS
jgi:hypothetical protein